MSFVGTHQLYPYWGTTRAARWHRFMWRQVVRRKRYRNRRRRTTPPLNPVKLAIWSRGSHANLARPGRKLERAFRTPNSYRPFIYFTDVPTVATRYFPASYKIPPRAELWRRSGSTWLSRVSATQTSHNRKPLIFFHPRQPLFLGRKPGAKGVQRGMLCAANTFSWRAHKACGTRLFPQWDPLHRHPQWGVDPPFFASFTWNTTIYGPP